MLPPIPSLYITCKSPFHEVDDFVVDSIPRYNMKIVQLEGGMKEGLTRYLDGDGVEMTARNSHRSGAGRNSTHKRQVKAMFIGTRRTDPHGGEHLLLLQ